MTDTIWRMRVMVLLVITAGALIVWLPQLSFLETVTARTNTLKVHFLNVGQGDAILIETPDGVQVLVDGGVNNSVLRVLSKEMSFFDRSLDMVIGTHPDGDHIGGLVDVLSRYTVGAVLRTENDGSSTVWNSYTSAIQNEGAEVIFARQGQVFQLGSDVQMKVLFPVYSAENMESNASSIVLQIVYGDTEILLTGDAPKRIEEYLVTQGADIQSDVLKLGHHGSKTSTSEVFLKTVDPQYTVISSGKDNKYGHPHTEVTDLLNSRSISTLNTAQEGTITFISDGTKAWLK